jgi:hypothetical protein
MGHIPDRVMPMAGEMNFQRAEVNEKCLLLRLGHFLEKRLLNHS